MSQATHDCKQNGNGAAHKYGRVFNFNAGPGALPLEVLEEAQRDLLNFRESGMSLMEISHRSKEFEAVIRQAEADLRQILGIPANYKVMFLQGGGSTQFAQVPMNLFGEKAKGDYIVTGVWSKKAAQEAGKYGAVNIAASSEKDGGFQTIPAADTWKTTSDGSSAYLYYCANETVHGIEFPFVPEPPAGVPLVADFSSTFLSSPIDVTKYGLIFAGAQKNIGPAGVTVVIVREDLIGESLKVCPTVMDYKTQASNESMYNTPPTWSIYVTGLTFKHVLKHGGLEGIAKANKQKAALVYNYIDSSKIYSAPVDRNCRSNMNIVFRVGDATRKPDAALEKRFVTEADKRGLIGLAGHRSVGGMRASLYNAVTLEACTTLVEFMKSFEATVLAGTQ